MHKREQEMQGKETQQTGATRLLIFTHNGEAHHLITKDMSLIGNPIIKSLYVTWRDSPKGNTHL
jgi:hypothetical protein